MFHLLPRCGTYLQSKVHSSQETGESVNRYMEAFLPHISFWDSPPPALLLQAWSSDQHQPHWESPPHSLGTQNLHSTRCPGMVHVHCQGSSLTCELVRNASSHMSTDQHPEQGCSPAAVL